MNKSKLMMIINGGQAWERSISPTLTPIGTNMDFEAGSPPTGWTAYTGATLASVADPRTGSTGTKCISVTNGAADYGFAGQDTTLAYGTLVIAEAWIKSMTPAVNGNVRLTGAANIIDLTSGPTAWAYKYASGLVDQANPYIGLWAGNNEVGEEYRFDDLAFTSMTLASCLKTQRRTATGDFVVSQRLRVVALTWMGFCLNMDSATNPQNHVLAFVDGVNAYLYYCVGGVYTRYSTACTWVDDDEFKVTKTGTTYKLYQNNVQVGVDQTINQAAINNNTLHMQFSNYGGNGFTSPFVL